MVELTNRGGGRAGCRRPVCASWSHSWSSSGTSISGVTASRVRQRGATSLAAGPEPTRPARRPRSRPASPSCCRSSSRAIGRSRSPPASWPAADAVVDRDHRLPGQISLVQVAWPASPHSSPPSWRPTSRRSGGSTSLSVTGPNFPEPIACVFGLAAAVLLGFLVGLPALRIRGVQLAIVTIAAASGPIGNLLLQNESISSAGPGPLCRCRQAALVRRLRLGHRPRPTRRTTGTSPCSRARFALVGPRRRQPAPRRHRPALPRRAGQRAGGRGRRHRRGPHEAARVRHRRGDRRPGRHHPELPAGHVPPRVLLPVRRASAVLAFVYLGGITSSTAPSSAACWSAAVSWPRSSTLHPAAVRAVRADPRRDRPDPHRDPQPRGHRRRHAAMAKALWAKVRGAEGRRAARPSRTRRGGGHCGPVADPRT